MSVMSIEGWYWEASVSCDDGRTEIYRFRHRRDLMSSIATTWSKIPETIRVDDQEQQVTVRDAAGDKVHLTARCVHHVEVLDGPTHF